MRTAPALNALHHGNGPFVVLWARRRRPLVKRTPPQNPSRSDANPSLSGVGVSPKAGFFENLYGASGTGIESKRYAFLRTTVVHLHHPSFRGVIFMVLRLLAALPFIGILLGVPFVNRVEPLVLGMPLVLAWIVFWVVMSAVIMALVYRLDPANRAGAATTEEAGS